jgi:hypothetical protein
VTSIGERAFSNCSGLTNIEIPSSVTSIGDYAFSDCSGLTSIVIPSSVASIGEAAFLDCSGLTSIVIPSSVKSIEWFAFDGCSKLTTVYYGGTSATAWNAISIGSYNNPLTNAMRYYYSETNKAGNYWHYVNGVPEKW